MLIAAGMQLIGSVLRSVPTGNVTISTVLIYFGQIIANFTGPVSMAAPPLISSTWFPLYQRTTATASSYCSVGTLLGEESKTSFILINCQLVFHIFE